MTAATLVVAGIVALAAGIVYAYVGSRIPRAAETPAARRALHMFSLWWHALALNIALVGGTYLLGALDLLTFEIQLVDSYLQRLLLCVSMVGLMHYLLYLLTGRDLLRPLIAFYALYFFALTWSMFARDPTGLFIGAWRTDLTFSRPESTSMRLVSLGSILLPPVAAALWYFRLFFRVHDPTRRWRIALISAAIVLWWAIAVLAGQRAALADTPIQIANRLLSLVAAFAALAAYAPPSWAQRRWGIAPGTATV